MSTGSIFTTKASATRAGLKVASQWLSAYRLPKPDAIPVQVKGQDFFAENQTEQLLTKRMAGEIGLSVASADPACQKNVYTRRGMKEANLYRVSDCVPKRISKPPRCIDLLLATWTVNRAAKRRRDLAILHYDESRYGLATDSRQRKEELYHLKDVGLRLGISVGRLSITKHIESESGTFACVEGEGYVFHSPNLHDDSAATVPMEGSLFIEAKPKSKREARLVDAVFTLEKLSSRD